MSDAFATGHPLEDEGPVLGPGWWHAVSFLLFVGAAIVGWNLFQDGETLDEQRRQILWTVVALAALPLTITIWRLVSLRRKLGNAQLFVPYRYMPMGYSGTATYMRPLRGATVRQIEARLQCEEELEKGSGKNRRTYTEIVYDEPLAPVTTPMMERMRVQVPFRIPEKGPPSMSVDRATIRWLIRLRLTMDGCPNTRSSFELQIEPVVLQR